ncbi:unnamed protein product [Vitrella brassicaformis CCMP3155]|uniref:Uncharacterized protein n=1 Tax=Vitrella brassicaformis (strain CCMP3155) TaxID=1169540 RepID=A0A0G4F7Y9_VITBC|nr:unnamed protein product [Vitrella brassicaformis CCMP3155]|eukprot:CEM08828.1 unnamed protein product [Vitrella brassicaformis CCMP3155]
MNRHEWDVNAASVCCTYESLLHHGSLPPPLCCDSVCLRSLTHSPMASSHPMPPNTPQPPAAPAAVPSLPDLAITRAADMAMSPHSDRRAMLRQCIDRLPQAKASAALTLVEVRIQEAIGRLGLEDVLVFDVGGLEDGLKVVHLLEQGSGAEWRAMGRFIRLAAIYRLTPNAPLPLRLSADALPSPTSFHQLPLAMAIYRLFGHLLTYHGQSLALQQAGNGVYRIDNQSLRVVALSDLPAGNPYRSGYQTTDPVMRQADYLYRSFSSLLLSMLLTLWHREAGVGHRWVLTACINDNDPRYRCLLTEPISEQQGIAVDYRFDNGNLNYAHPIDYRFVTVSGFRPNETIAAQLFVGRSVCAGLGVIDLSTTERHENADRSQPLDDRYPISMPRWGAVLQHFSLENDVINRGMVLEYGVS